MMSVVSIYIYVQALHIVNILLRVMAGYTTLSLRKDFLWEHPG